MRSPSTLRTPVEVTPGKFKLLRLCTPKEWRQAARMSEQKGRLIDRWTELLESVDDDEPVGNLPPLTRSSARGDVDPGTITLADLRAEVQALERLVGRH